MLFVYCEAFVYLAQTAKKLSVVIFADGTIAANMA
jgi:hypothetical protein